MAKKNKKSRAYDFALRQEIIKLLDKHQREGYREFLVEVAEDCNARLMCLDDEENPDHG